MTDFLTNLVARTIATPTLRPRTRMRFEPVSEEAMPLPDVATPHTSSSRPLTSDPEPPEVITETREVPITETVIVPRERTVTITKEKRVVIPQEHTRILREREEVQVPEAVPPHRGELQAPTRVIERVAPAQPTAARTPPGQPAGAPAVRSVERVRTVREASIMRTAGVLAGWPAGVPPALPVTGGRTQPGQPPARARSVVASEPAQPAQEPTIHVSIGRVEVRAVAPTTTASKAHAPKPMSIDDYVARREKKERR